eukprot:m.135158 g.135158  ORF g.135158 m.135158 type:complete len:245 (+) comp9854_c0_seq1:43-777(+)
MTTKACCEAGKPVTMEHTDKGKEIKLGEFDAYVSGSPVDAKAPVVILYDIFGLDHPQVREVTDRFAEQGYYAVMPDIFRKKPWSLDSFPPPDKNEFKKFLGRIDEPVLSDIEVLKEHFKEVGLGEKKIGVAGFCWGGKWCMTLCADPAFGAGFSAHPAFITLEMAKAVVAPMVLCPAKGDIDCVPLIESMKEKEFGEKCLTKRFDNMIHGFCAARGNWDDETVANAVKEALDLAFNLFNSTIGQ